MTRPDDIPRADVLLVGVTGGTGVQAVRGMLEQGTTGLAALTRNPNSDAAKNLQSMGVHLRVGDLDDADSIRRAIAGTPRVYVHGMTADSAALNTAEVDRAKSFAAVAKAAGVEHLTYNSNAGYGRTQGVVLAEQKHHVEEILRGSGLTCTMLRATVFMEEWWKAHNRPDVLAGVLKLVQPADRSQSFVSVRDMGRAAAMVLANPAAFPESGYDLAADTLTPVQMAEAFADAQGSPVRFEALPDGLFASMPDFHALVRWYNEVGFDADLDASRRRFPGMWRFADFLQKTHWADESRSYESFARAAE